MLDVAAFLRKVQAHRWSPRRIKMVEQLMDEAKDVDAIKQGRVSFHLGTGTSAIEIAPVKPKERYDD